MPFDDLDITQLLNDYHAGDAEAGERVIPAVYDVLHKIAAHHLRGERAGATLSSTALVHEAYERLVQMDALAFESRAHFFSLASLAMRRVLVERARRRNALRRGGGVANVPLDVVQIAAHADDTDILALDDALDALDAHYPRKAQIVHLRFFGGFSMGEIAEILDISLRTADRDWRFARAYLLDAVQGR